MPEALDSNLVIKFNAPEVPPLARVFSAAIDAGWERALSLIGASLRSKWFHASLSAF